MKDLLGVLAIIGVLAGGGFFAYQKLTEKRHYEESDERVTQMLTKLSAGNRMDRQLAMGYWYHNKPFISEDAIRANLDRFDEFVEDAGIDEPDDFDCETVEVVRDAQGLLGYVECDVDGDELYLRAPLYGPLELDED